MEEVLKLKSSYKTGFCERVRKSRVVERRKQTSKTTLNSVLFISSWTKFQCRITESAASMVLLFSLKIRSMSYWLRYLSFSDLVTHWGDPQWRRTAHRNHCTKCLNPFDCVPLKRSNRLGCPNVTLLYWVSQIPTISFRHTKVIRWNRKRINRGRCRQILRRIPGSFPKFI